MKLKAKQKKFLKRLSQKEITTIQIGKEGITDNLITHIKDVLKHKELVKIKILDVYISPIKQSIGEILDRTGSFIVKSIGKTFIIYKESKALEKEEKIILPE